MKMTRKLLRKNGNYRLLQNQEFSFFFAWKLRPRLNCTRGVISSWKMTAKKSVWRAKMAIEWVAILTWNMWEYFLLQEVISTGCPMNDAFCTAYKLMTAPDLFCVKLFFNDICSPSSFSFDDFLMENLFACLDKWSILNQIKMTKKS